ncbi:MAG: hypothetical protein ABIJ47_08090 [Candidatus Bathyarchaeota archaeon]
MINFVLDKPALNSLFITLKPYVCLSKSLVECHYIIPKQVYEEFLLEKPTSGELKLVSRYCSIVYVEANVDIDWIFENDRNSGEYYVFCYAHQNDNCVLILDEEWNKIQANYFGFEFKTTTQLLHYWCTQNYLNQTEYEKFIQPIPA